MTKYVDGKPVPSFSEAMRLRWEAFRKDVASIDWARWPTFRHEKYSYGTAGVEFTWTEGVGIGLGLGVFDIWVGWPRKDEKLHYKGCGHKKPNGSFYTNPKPAEV